MKRIFAEEEINKMKKVYDKAYIKYWGGNKSRSPKFSPISMDEFIKRLDRPKFEAFVLELLANNNK